MDIKYLIVKIKTLGTPHGYQVGKYKPFGKKKLPSLKKNPDHFRARFENATENQFFDFGKYEPKSSNFFRIVIIYYFMRKMLSDSILDFRK